MLLNEDGVDRLLLDGEDWGIEIPLGETGGNVSVGAVLFLWDDEGAKEDMQKGIMAKHDS